jgi:hypothetical protein
MRACYTSGQICGWCERKPLLQQWCYWSCTQPVAPLQGRHQALLLVVDDWFRTWIQLDTCKFVRE